MNMNSTSTPVSTPNSATTPPPKKSFSNISQRKNTTMPLMLALTNNTVT